MVVICSKFVSIVSDYGLPHLMNNQFIRFLQL